MDLAWLGSKTYREDLNMFSLFLGRERFKLLQFWSLFESTRSMLRNKPHNGMTTWNLLTWS